MELVHEKFGAIRAAEKDGTYWFCAKDVCDALELTNTSMAIQPLDDDEKGIRIFYTPGGEQEMLAVNESGLYALILRSNKPRAREFRKWVTNEVLPSLRRTGKYEMTGKTAKQLARLAEKENEKAYKQLIAEIRQHVDQTDAEFLAKRLRLNPETVWKVWMGWRKNTSIIRELYEYALKNRQHKELFYTARGIDAALKVLRGEVDVKQLPGY